MKQALAFFAVATFAAAAAAAASDASFDTQRLADHIRVLSSDEFEGRGPATRAEQKTVDYISREFKAAGLQPGGDPRPHGARAWTQSVPLSRFSISGPVRIAVTSEGRTQQWTQGDQLIVRAAQTGDRRVDIRDAPVVFIGYGVAAPERRWDDFKGFDMHGKIGLVLVNDPDFETGVGDFGGKAMTYYGRWTYKYEEAARRGALGVLVIHERNPAGYGWATVKNSQDDVFDIIRKNPRAAHATLEGWIQREPAVALLKSAGLDFDALKLQAQTRDFRPVELKGVTLSAGFEVKADRIVTRNVIGVVPGRGHAGEHVMYTAHWDHLGIGRPDASGDRIYHGAVDNASGVSVLIELARAFAHGPRPDRSLVFMATTSEEKGLVGSEYYATNPVYPLATTVAVLNMDGMGVLGRARDVSAAGDSPLTLQDDLVRVAKAHGLALTPEAHPEYGSYFRNDHFPFAKHGVPALTMGLGRDLENGGREASEAAYQSYIRDKYHQPGDKFDPSWDLSGMVQEAELFHDFGAELANGREWPQWKEGAEFKAERDATRALRR
jgi:Zn-dependent M28 family amino/carboxypeptidase